jgi:hypothetical protein
MLDTTKNAWDLVLGVIQVARATFVYEPSADLHTAERVFDLHQGRKEN